MRSASPCLILSALFLNVFPLFAQQDLALTIGALSGPNRVATSRQTLNFSSGVAFQGNYSRYIRSYKHADLYGEIHVLASPQQQVTSTLTSATRDFSALYVTPGVKVKFYPKKKLSPWATAGGGYAMYAQSTKTIAGAVNAAPRHAGSGAFQFGGGMDYLWNSRYSFRVELREFYTGSPKFNTPVFGRGQFHFVLGAGIVIHLGAK